VWLNRKYDMTVWVLQPNILALQVYSFPPLGGADRKPPKGGNYELANAAIAGKAQSQST
jgi:hypothetical protein